MFLIYSVFSVASCEQVTGVERRVKNQGHGVQNKVR